VGGEQFEGGWEWFEAGGEQLEVQWVSLLEAEVHWI
jgi:hypothetical protein